MAAGTGGVERDFRPLSSGPSAANAAVSVRIEPRGGARVQLGMLGISYSGAAATGGLTVSDSDVSVLDVDVQAAGFTSVPLPGDGLSLESGQAVVVTAKAGGAAVVGKIALAYRYIYDR